MYINKLSATKIEAADRVKPGSDVWDSYDQWEHFIPEIPDGRRFLR